MRISIIAAIGKNREIGFKNTLLWNIPADLAHFKRLTQNHTVVMGRKTFESIGKPLAKRLNIVITRHSSLEASKSVIVVNSLDYALSCAQSRQEKQVFIIGGGQIYAQSLNFAHRLYLTHVHASFPCADVFFPKYKDKFPVIVSKSRVHTSGKYRFHYEVRKRE